LALPFFAATLFVSAFLLFLVQPMIGKTILPQLGGTPQVWNTCMVFFQMTLLAGYAYTHTVSSRLKLRQQLILHSVMLLLPLIVLLVLSGMAPFNAVGFRPPPGANPIGYTLWFLLQIVGLPFLVVATSAPLLQRWFAYTGHPAAKDPYFLYGASNLGSLLALIAYPILIEPYVRLRSLVQVPDTNDTVAYFFSQPWVWTIGYFVLVGMVLVCAAMVWKAAPTVQLAGASSATVEAPAREEAAPEPVATQAASTAVKAGAATGASRSTAIKKGGKQKGPQRPPQRKVAAPPPPPEETQRLQEVTPLRRLRWVVLAAVPSSLMLGVTTYITTDLSPIPLFWLIPLTLYLLSFILVFAKWPVVWTGQPHKVFLMIQPAAIAALLILNAGIGDISAVTLRIVINVLAFFVTTMVCHGELAKDRPSTKHLTEFYLWMSVGGMLGGMFNGLVAPILFWGGTWEFPLAVFAACLVRPLMKEGGWLDSFFAQMFAKPGHGRKAAEETDQLHYTLDIVLALAVLALAGFMSFVLSGPIGRMFSGSAETQRNAGTMLAFGIPLIIACFFYARPLRFGLSIGAVLLIQVLHDVRGENTLYADRSYFGILRVTQVQNELGLYYSLRHGTTLHGQNFRRPEDRALWGKKDKDFSRLANTYYHRRGPAGRVMEMYNWGSKTPAHPENEAFPPNTYYADARMPASIVGLGTDVWSGLVNLQSEPPYAVIGLGTGTMASYCRPYQHLDYYEIDDHVRVLSEELPSPDSPFFTYIHDARERGGIVWILMGDARLKMAEPYLTLDEAREKMRAELAVFYADTPEGARLRKQARAMTGGPEGYYHMMVVDAFSSDAIPIHLLTKEAMAMYFKHLTKEGILCVHTSNRHIDLVPVVADVAASLGYVARRGHDADVPRNDPTGHSTSEWVMVAREAKYLEKLTEPPEFDPAKNGGPYWEWRVGTDRHVWTDDFSNVMSVYRDNPFASGVSRR
jgi:hypothetical protein